MAARNKSNYTVSRDSRSGAWYAHMKGFPYVPIEGSFSERRADTAEYAKLYNGQKNHVEEIERKRKEEGERFMNIACRNCENLMMEERNGGRNSFYCMHPEAFEETMPHRRIAKSRSDEIPIKTAPRWCPLKQDKGRKVEG